LPREEWLLFLRQVVDSGRSVVTALKVVSSGGKRRNRFHSGWILQAVLRAAFIGFTHHTHPVSADAFLDVEIHET